MNNLDEEKTGHPLDEARLLLALKEARKGFRTIEFSADGELIEQAIGGRDDPRGRLDDIAHHAQQAGNAIDQVLAACGEAPAHIQAIHVPAPAAER